MINFVGVSKDFKSGVKVRRVKALDNLSLDIDEGDIFGFLGPNGAGKSTAIKVLMNLIYPDEGSVSIMKRDVGNKDVRRFVGYLPENPYFYDYLTAEELLWFGGKASGMSKIEIQKRTSLLLDKVRLLDARKRPLRTYSKGMVQRAGLALALIHNPAVVILDEPMSGLDPIGRKMFGDIILELKSEGKTVFFSSHILSDVERFCDKVGIIVSGRLRLTGSVTDLLKDGGMLETVFLREVNAAGLKEVK